MKNEQPSLDLKEFWARHDRALAQHESGGEVTLSHDLYRGMPPWFNAYYAFFQRRAVLRLLQKIKLQPGLRALDIGCGTGRWTGLMLSLGLHTYGFDVGEQVVRYAADRWRDAHFCQGGLPFLGFASNSLDLAISVTVLQHIAYEQQPLALQSIARVLKPGGHLLICETIDAGDPSPHIFGNRAVDWLKLFQDAGLQWVGQAGCEYLPHVKLYQSVRHLWPVKASSQADVSAVARSLKTRPLLALLIHLLIAVSYPLEYLATMLLPWQWAHLGCFLLRKP